MSDTPLIKGGRGDRHPPYQGGIKGGSEAKSIFNLIITTYLKILRCFRPVSEERKLHFVIFRPLKLELG
ncbi:MAG: hypothetical protein EWV48_12930 [Microcystis aeruginosa Ma_QC_C_20070823_S13]|nr:MAG: hypothetical protein EWV48_12930 [Microcystis aeruginosa Ma_QC_C_20070823_S13]TRU62455.1 MAG: hypothetical protein EWV56_07150 [Microcystis aeruginosa Ma_QC_C_20070823_S13D]